MRKLIDIAVWERVDTFNFFKSFLIPTYNVTTEVDCTEAFAACKQKKISYACLTMYAAMRALNEIREMRYRIEDNGATPVEYDQVDLMTPIKINENGKFVDTYIPYSDDFTIFQKSYAEAKKIAIENPKDSKIVITNEITTAFVSCTPDLYFTTLTHANDGSRNWVVNLVNIGKVVACGERLVMPVATTVHHGLCDGHHVAIFFRKMEQYLKIIL